MTEELAVPREMGYGHREAVALRKIGNPANFHWYSLEFVKPDATVLVGCVVTRSRTKGKDKGRPAYDGEPVKAIVTESEVKTELQRYETETGLCGECYGKGETWAGWSKDEGHKHRTCRKCNGAKVAGGAE